MMDWEFVKLSDLMTIVGGGTPKTSNDDYWNGSIPWLSVVDFNNDERWVNRTEKQITVEGLNQSSTKLLNKGDLIISARGTVGQLAQLGKDMAFNQSCYGLRAKLEIGNDFLYYLVKYSIRKLLRNVHGGVFDTITRNTFELIECQISKAKNERDEIAKTLSSLDQKITLLRQQNETLEEMAQTLFKRWFVDFEFPNEQGQPYRSAGGEMVASELGEIPLGWEVGMLGDVATLKSGYAFKSNDFIENGNNKALKIKDLKGNGIVSLGDVSSVSNDIVKKERVQFFKLKEGDIVLAMSGNTTGKIGIVPPHKKELYLNQRVGKFFLKKENLTVFLYNFLMSGNYETKILSMGYGSAQPNISPSQIGKIELLIPKDNLFNDYNNIANPIYLKVLNNNNEIQTLTKLRDTFLPKLMSGEIRVPTALENKV